MAYVLIKFANSPRPDLWVLERSTDFGLTYEPWQYFACKYASVTRELQLSARQRGRSEDGSLCKLWAGFGVVSVSLLRCGTRPLFLLPPVRLQELKLGSEQLGEAVVLLRAGEFLCCLGLHVFFKALSLVPTQISVDARVGTGVNGWAWPM